MHKRRQEAHPESVLLALRALGAPIATMGDIQEALAARQAELQRGLVEPVFVAWEGRIPLQQIRLPRNSKATLVLEDGNTSPWPPPRPLPQGYHRLHVTSKAGGQESLIISAPVRAHFPLRGKTWGVFAPVYALHSKRSAGAGDLTDLESLIDWTRQHDGRVVSTLPLLANFLDKPFEPSPYSPISRLFWSDFYIDPTRTPEFALSREAQDLIAAVPANRSKYVDYRTTMLAKRQVLEALARTFFEHANENRRDGFQRFLAENPETEQFARFRALTDKHQRGWHEWPADASAGDRNDERYHLYVQWLIQTQLHDLSTKCRGLDCLLYLDLPLGLHRDSFDAWKYPNLFAKGMSAGAPPDPVFTAGQDWSFQPIHPQALRRDGYEYVIAYLRNHLRFAKLLRIDHVMGLHRLYWIPEGLKGDRGLYVQYPAEEMYAILSLESHRAGAGIVGENLGIVPPFVNRSMSRHNIRQLYVAQYETVIGSGKSGLKKPPAGCVASLNTHDMFPFRAFLDGKDIDESLKLGFLSPKDAVAARRQRARVRRALRRAYGAKVFEGCMEFLGKSRAGIVLQNLEDLWGEVDPQNIPSTTTEHANWRRRMRYSMERLRRMGPGVSR
jgi:4-alpha-glucanotransferase